MNQTPEGLEENKCVFCDITKIKSAVIEYKGCYIFEPLNPVVKGHRLIVPVTHVSDFTQDPQITGRVVEVASEWASDIGGEFNLITSKGKNATQSVFHLHVHLVPRKGNDGLLLPWNKTELSQQLIHLREKVEEIRDEVYDKDLEKVLSIIDKELQ